MLFLNRGIGLHIQKDRNRDPFPHVFPPGGGRTVTSGRFQIGILYAKGGFCQRGVRSSERADHAAADAQSLWPTIFPTTNPSGSMTKEVGAIVTP